MEERDRFSLMGGNVEEEYKQRSSHISSPSFIVGEHANGGGAKYIYHTVTKFDTLAGVAIKYGVEVADIKRLNGLVTDLQMFALETLRIPLPGRHPPSSNLLNGDETPQRPCSSEPTSRRNSDLFDSFQSLKLRSSSERKAPSAMSSLRSYYGLKSEDPKPSAEMSFYISKPNPRLSQHRKSKSIAYGLTSENGDLISQIFAAQEAETDIWIEKLTRRRQISNADFNSQTPEMILKEENCTNTPISSITGKGLALRPKSASRLVSGGVNGESSIQNTTPLSFGDCFSTMRKSSSTPSLQDSEDSGALSSISKWSLKPDFQSLSALAIARPIFDGLPKPTSRKNKAALD